MRANFAGGKAGRITSVNSILILINKKGVVVVGKDNVLVGLDF